MKIQELSVGNYVRKSDGKIANNCTTYKELFGQAFGGGSVSLRIYEVCQMIDSPEREEFYKKINSYEDC